jgi:hypothetical protein
LPDTRLENVAHMARLDQRNIGKFLLAQSQLDRPPFRLFPQRSSTRELAKDE